MYIDRTKQGYITAINITKEEHNKIYNKYKNNKENWDNKTDKDIAIEYIKNELKTNSEIAEKIYRCYIGINKSTYVEE